MSQAAQTTAAPAESIASAAGLTEFISFAIGDDQYGVDIMAVREIKGWSEITRLPEQPDYVRGVLNLRGTIVPIIDLRKRFDLIKADYTPTTVVIVLSVTDKSGRLTKETVLGDEVREIVGIKAAAAQATQG